MVIYTDFALILSNNILHRECADEVAKRKGLHQLLKSNATTKSIINTLGFKNDKKTQEKVKNKKQYLKTKVQRNYKLCNEYDLIAWCNNHLITSTNEMVSNPTKPFVFDYIVEKNFYCIFMSTYTLFQDYINYCKSYEVPNVIQLDGTYRLVHNNYVLLVMGSQDFGGLFHLLAICLTSNEDERAYEFMLVNAQELFAQLSFDLIPEYTMSDGARAIVNAIEEVLGTELAKLMCCFHAKFNMQKKNLCLIFSRD